jgi:hypothetical protein
MALTLVVMRHGERLDQHLRDGGAPDPAPAASAALPLGRDMDGRALVAGDATTAIGVAPQGAPSTPVAVGGGYSTWNVPA